MHLNGTGSMLLYTMAYVAQNFSSPTLHWPNDTEVKCYGVYGCFPLKGIWISEYRQMNLPPESPFKIDPKFPVFTNRNRTYPKFIDLDNPWEVVNFGINPNEKIFFISHGFLESGDKQWINKMMNALLDREPNGTVVAVDWHGGSSPPYIQAVANTRVVGAVAGHVIHLLYQELNLPNLDRVHFIGHSLGSHIAGYAGHTLKKDFGLKLGRITGLDPAEPLFAQTHPYVRLDRTDAKYVDVIHTDATSGGLGMILPIGHVDFYPNGGSDNPGCGGSSEYTGNSDDSFIIRLHQDVSCNHLRSYQYFTESINSKCPFTAITCDSFENYKNGECFHCDEDGHYCLQMGYDSTLAYNQLKNEGISDEDSSVVAYLLTAPNSPYCRLHYRLTLKVSASDESALHGGEIGSLSLKLHSHSHRRKETEKISFYPEPFLFEPGLLYTSVVAGSDIGEILYATATWDYKTNLLNPLSWRILATPRIFIDYLIIDSLEYKTSIRLCPVHQSPIISGSATILQEKYCTEEQNLSNH